jgi:uncharacterized protein YacL
MIGPKKFDVFDLIIIQIPVGLASAFLGAIIFSSLSYTHNNGSSLFDDMLYAFIGASLGTLVGIGFASYKYLESYKRQTSFLRLLGQSLIGMILGFIVSCLFIPALKMYNSSLLSFLAVAMPFIGAISGFNFRLAKTLTT